MQHRRSSHKAPTGHQCHDRARVRGWRRPRGRPMMSTKKDPVISASRGTLAGDVLWLGTIAFVFAIITGMVG
jgi:hypothetical protein